MSYNLLGSSAWPISLFEYHEEGVVRGYGRGNPGRHVGSIVGMQVSTISEEFPDDLHQGPQKTS